jgi:hypothetical protein
MSKPPSRTGHGPPYVEWPVSWFTSAGAGSSPAVGEALWPA